MTDYAITDPGEDIAESKILFYEHPELVELRAEIVTRLYAYLRRP